MHDTYNICTYKQQYFYYIHIIPFYFLLFSRTVGALNLRVEDGFLDPESNYTAFVEIVVPEGILPGKNIIGRSPYMIPRKPGEYVYPGKVTIIYINIYQV